MWKSLKGRLVRFLLALLENEQPDFPQIPRFADEDHLLQIVKVGPRAGAYFIGKRKLKDEEVQALKGEAMDFKKSYLWQLMRRDVHYLAYLQSTAKRHTETDALYGSAMYRDLEILEKFIENCTEL